MRTPTNITRHELIGLSMQIVDAQNKSLVGLAGEIVDETKNTLVIETTHGEKKILKKGARFLLHLPTTDVIVDGNVLLGRPEERIKK